MKGIRRALRLYVLAIMTAACLVLVAFAPQSAPAGLGLALALFVFATVAQLRPIHLTQKMKLTVEDAATFAAALLLTPWLACVVAASSTLAAAARRRGAPWFEGVFNASVTCLATFGGATVFGLSRTQDDWRGSFVIGAGACAAVMYLAQTAIVDIAVGLQLRRNPVRTWWAVHQRDIAQSGALYGLGGLMAIVGALSPFAI